MTGDLEPLSADASERRRNLRKCLLSREFQVGLARVEEKSKLSGVISAATP